MKALERIHAVLDAEQRERLAYLIRTGTLQTRMGIGKGGSYAETSTIFTFVERQEGIDKLVKPSMSDDIMKRVEGYQGEVMFGEHHESHAASAFYPSPFEQAAVLTVERADWRRRATYSGMASAGTLRRRPTVTDSRSPELMRR